MGVVYRPPGGGDSKVGEFTAEMTKILTKMRGIDGYVMGDFNIDLLRTGMHGPTSGYMEGFNSVGFYPLVAIPTRLTSDTATLIDNVWTNNLRDRIVSGAVTVRVSDHLPIYVIVGGESGAAAEGEKGQRRRLVNEGRMRGLGKCWRR